MLKNNFKLDESKESPLKLVLKVNNQSEMNETPLTKSVTKRPYKRRKTVIDINEESSQSLIEEGKTNAIEIKSAKEETNLQIKILKDEANKTPFQHFLAHMQKLLQRKDFNGFFAYPVTDTLAPGYSLIITKPMDFHTMQIKIEKNIYKSFTEYKNDYKLMLYNCMKYNHPESIYHKDALRMLVTGNKYMSKDRILQMKRSLAFMSEVTKQQLGLDDDLASSFIKKPKGKDKRFKSDECEILEQVEHAAKKAAENLSQKRPNDKIGFLRFTEDGTTTFNFLNPDNVGKVSEVEQVIRLGEMVGDVDHGTNKLLKTFEDKRNIVNNVNGVKYESFGSFLPSFDSSESNISKQDSALLLSVYGNEEGIQYAHSIKNFVADTNDYVISMVDELLDVLTNGDHSKYMKEDQINIDSEVSNQIQDKTVSDNMISNTLDYFDSKLQQTSELLIELHNLQRNRLSASIGTNTEPEKFFNQELKIAKDLTSQLKSLVQETNPGNVISTEALHKAMGIKLPQDNEDANKGNVNVQYIDNNFYIENQQPDNNVVINDNFTNTDQYQDFNSPAQIILANNQFNNNEDLILNEEVSKYNSNEPMQILIENNGMVIDNAVVNLLVNNDVNNDVLIPNNVNGLLLNNIDGKMLGSSDMLVVNDNGILVQNDNFNMFETAENSCIVVQNNQIGNLKELRNDQNISNNIDINMISSDDALNDAKTYSKECFVQEAWMQGSVKENIFQNDALVYENNQLEMTKNFSMKNVLEQGINNPLNIFDPSCQLVANNQQIMHPNILYNPQVNIFEENSFNSNNQPQPVNVLIENRPFTNESNQNIPNSDIHITSNNTLSGFQEVLSDQQLTEQQNAVMYLNSLDSNIDLEYRMILDECIAPE